MIIEHLKWREIIIKHKTSKKEFKNKSDVIAQGYLAIDERYPNAVFINEDNSFIDSPKNFLFGNPKLIKLNAWEIEIEAEWWATKFVYSKKDPTKCKMVRLPEHKVIITAKF